MALLDNGKVFLMMMLEIDAYNNMKGDEAIIELTKIMDQETIQPLTDWCKNLLSMHQKLYGYNISVREGQRKLFELWLAEKIQEERKELKKIRHSTLNSAFDALEELAYVGRTSVRNYMLAKKIEQRAKTGVGTKNIQKEDELFQRTYNFDANVTVIFNQHLKVQSISKSYLNSMKEELSLVSSLTSIVSANASTCSLITETSDSSFLLKKYKLDENGNVS